MKWLFFALVALNFIVFGGTTLHKIAAEQEAEMIARRKAAGEKLAQTSASLAEPMVKPKGGIRPSESPASAPASGDWLHDNGGAQDVFIEPTDTEEDVAKRISERERWQEENKRRLAREEADRRNRQNRGFADSGGSYGGEQSAPSAAGGRQCTATANVTMPEDDYHRIKGLLAKWPHAANRTVERREAPKSKTTYAVWTPIQIDAGSQMQALQEKGFNTVLMEGGISVGIRADRAQAQALLSRLQGAGFSGQLREINSAGSGGQSVAKMQVTFMTVNEADAKAIQNIVGSYGRLSRNKCR